MNSLRYSSRLRLSLLASLGLMPLACGGTTRSADEAEGGVGAGAQGGAPTRAGAPSGGAVTHAGSSGQAGDGGQVAVQCTSPHVKPDSGLVTCEEGFTHRPTVEACGNAASKATSLPRVKDYVACEADASVCDAYQYGYCLHGQVAACVSGCVVDADCGQGMICLCGSELSPSSGECVGSSCGSDGDCQPGHFCASYSNGCGGGYACQTPQDTCRSWDDCAEGQACVPMEDGHWECTGRAICGRPFLVEAQARLAPVLNGGEWSSMADATPRVDHLTSAERAELAAHWARLGQMEHASIAAFARFSLQLLSLGAPPALVEACTRALGDETAHAQLCFRIASVYAGRTLGPGPLDVSGSLELTSLGEIVELVIAEGCFGETGAALEALEAAEDAADPVIRAAYQRIAADEERHAELAFQFVRWALAREPQVASRLQAACRQPPRAHARAWSVALPCFDALLAS